MLTLLALLLLAGCRSREAEVAPPQALTLNVVEAAGLREAVSIEILELPAPGAGGAGSSSLVATVTDPGEVAAIVAALDADLPLGPRARCPERYRLRFILKDGSAQEFGYVCDGASFLRGDQPFWDFKDAAPSEVFQQLVGEQLNKAAGAEPGG